MLSEPEAWQYLADLWGDPKSFPVAGQFVVRLPGNHSGQGLCACVAAMEKEHQISGKVAARMHYRLAMERVRLGAPSLYIWPPNKHGAESRLRFCVLQASPHSTPALTKERYSDRTADYF